MKPTLRFLLLCGLASSLSEPAAASAKLTYHGRLLDSGGNAVVSNTVKFKVQIRSPGSEDCLMYEEIHVRNMSASAGTFALSIGDSPVFQANAELVNGVTSNLDWIFQNRGTYNFVGGKCAGGGTTYMPGLTDARRIMVEVDDGGLGAWDALPEQFVNFVPLSLESVTVGGYKSGELFRVNDVSNTPVAMPAWTQADYNKLVNIVAGTDGTYLKTEADPSVPASIKDGIDASEVSSASGKYFTYAPNGAVCSSGDVLKWTGSNRWECGTDNTGAGAPADATTAVKGIVLLAADGGTTASTVVQATDSRLSNSRPPNGTAGGDLDGTYPSPDVVKLRGSAISATTPAADQVLVYSASAWTPVNFGIGQLRTSLGAAQFANASCADNQTLTWSALTDAVTCSNINNLNADKITAGTLNIARLPTGSSGTTVAIGNDARFPAGTCGSGNTMRWDGTAWQCEAAASGADNLGNHTATQNLNLGAFQLVGNGGSSGIAIDNSGNVGVGTAPTARLTVAGNTESSGWLRAGSSLFVRDWTNLWNTNAFMSTVSGSDLNGNEVWRLGDNNSGAQEVGLAARSGYPLYLAANGAEAVRITTAGNVGVGANNPTAKLEVQGQAVSRQFTIANGNAVDFNNGNLQVLRNVGNTAITLSNLVAGGSYTVVVEDLTSRTYTFPGCTTPYFMPANGPTDSRSIYTILAVNDGASGFNCYISWITGFN